MHMSISKQLIILIAGTSLSAALAAARPQEARLSGSAPASRPATSCPAPKSLPPLDNREGPFPLFEEAPVHPLELAAGGSELWVANIPDGSVSVFDASDPLRLRLSAEIPVGLGPVSVRRRPRTGAGKAGDAGDPVDPADEIWVVCQSSNSVFVIERAGRRVVDSIRVPFGPSGLAFDPAGRTAYVTLSASNRIARIDAAARRVFAPAIEFASTLPASAGTAHAQEPRSLLLEGNDLFVLSYKSGNGTTVEQAFGPGGPTVSVIDVWKRGWPPPPDRDVLRFDAARPERPGSAALWRMGTLNLDLARGGGGALYVSNVDLRNDRFTGKYAHRRNGFARHRVSYAVPSADGLPQPRSVHIDLNRDRDPRLPADYACAMPNAMAFSADRSRLYVACYETRNTVVVDTARDEVVAELRADLGSGAGFGPRGLALDEAAGVLYVYNRADNTVQAFRVPAAPGTASGPVGATVSAGLDATPAAIKAGRLHFIDARRSESRTHSCNSCHNDGRSDGLAWDLRDFTGDLPRAPEPRDENTLRVTMDLRGIEATPPYHWRGDRADLADFNPAFASLLGAAPLAPRELAELEAYVFALAHPPNPNQDPRRVYSEAALAGYGCFGGIAAHAVSRLESGVPTHGGDPAGRISVTCQDCHAMDGGLATNNQMINEVRFPVPQVTTSLRNVSEKRRDAVFYAGSLRPATGWGFGSTGMFKDVFDFIGMFPEVTVPQRRLLSVFLAELDTGMAPATAFAWTLTRERAAAEASPAPAAAAEGSQPGPVTGYLIPQAAAGNADLVARGTLAVGGRERRVGMLYDPRDGRFATDTAGVGPFTYGELAAAVARGGGVLTFLGVPVGSGYRFGLDRAMEFRGSGSAGSAGGPGSEPPAIAEEAIAWVASTVAKIRWTTDRPARCRVRVAAADGANGAGGASGSPGELVWSGEGLAPGRRHVMVVRGLQPDRRYDVYIDAEDLARPAGRSTSGRLTGERGIRTQSHLFPAVHVGETTLAAGGTDARGRRLLAASFRVLDEHARPVDGAVVHCKLLEWVPGRGATGMRRFDSSPSRGGMATLTMPSELPPGSGGIAEVVVDTAFDRGISDPGGRLYFHPVDGEFHYWARLALP
jgi:DNA-binding beta-propeller fold protein YncE